MAKGVSVKGKVHLDRGTVDVKRRSGTINGKKYEAMSGGVHKFDISTREKTATGSLTKGKRRTADGKVEKWSTKERSGITPGGRKYAATKYASGVTDILVEGGYSMTRGRTGKVYKSRRPDDYVRHKIEKGPTTKVKK